MKKIILALAAFGTTFSFIACGDDSSSTSPSSVESSSSESYESLDKSSSSTKDTKPAEESSSSVVESSSSTPIEDPDSKSEGVLSCDQKLKKTVDDGVTLTLHACGEVAYTDEIKELFDEVCPSEGPYDAIQGTGCASGAKKVCKVDDAGFEIVWYIYNEDAAGKSCEELLSEDFDIPVGEGSENSGESSDSKSESLLSCDKTLEMTVDGVTSVRHVCAESSYSPEKEKLMQCASEGSLTAIKGTGCPSGEKKVCKDEEEGFEVVFYVYDEYSASKSCEELLNEEMEIPIEED